MGDHEDYVQEVNRICEEYRVNPQKVLKEQEDLRQVINSVKIRIGETFLSFLTGDMIGGSVKGYKKKLRRLRALEDALSGKFGDYG